MQKVESFLEVMDLKTRARRVVFHTKDHIEAPNWSPDGATLVYNSGGLLYRVPAEGGTPERINTGALAKLNNDHGISPDGKWIVVSDKSEPDTFSRLFILPFEGGAPRQVIPQAPSWWHGWSPDGKRLAYVGARGNRTLNLYSCPVEGGSELRLTLGDWMDDGPDYSPDGRFIYFNSTRSGNMKLWRMGVDGASPEQITFEEDRRDWFAHPSPDGKWIVYLSFGTDILVTDHPPNKKVQLRLLKPEGGAPEVIAELFGGQGTINVPSWSPDSTHFAFVSYQLV
ncbi:Tol biopolymer transport system component [Rhizomicrobium palustre]|uniref:Tol biopolymer transport system component n=1 Tax=Rhizomicrobium palustre TaxID=189966 RepID=A0A846MZ53_9PROT|nr:PD40 domain-containing protein [Rhizomicrobium palustre]NIK88726.1 Tol biopolymer transport system component [Rhizomicrobium palustre]